MPRTAKRPRPEPADVWVTVPDDYWDWRVKLTFPALAGPAIRGKYRVPPGRRDRREKLAGIGGFGGGGVSDAQAAAIRWLVDHEALAAELVLAALAADARRRRAGGGWEEFDEPPGIDAVMPRGMTAADAAERVTTTGVGVSTKARDGLAYLEITGESAWDPDSGFVVVLHADRVVDVCQQGTGWVDKLPGGRRTR